MKKKLVALFAAALMTLSFAGTAMAAFVQGDLIRVVYDTVGSKEYATDLGSWATLTAATNGTTVGGGADAFTLANTGAASVSNLVVGYFLVTKNTQFSFAGDAGGGLTSETSANGRAYSNLNNPLGNYNSLAGAATSVVVADKTVGNTYYNLADGAGVTVGQYGGYVVNNPGGTMSLTALTTTGYVDQTIYSWTGLLNSAQTGVANFTVRTMADGSTILGNSNTAAVPVPPAFFLMGSGLLGIFGVRRKMNA